MRRIILICACIFVAVGCFAQKNDSVEKALEEKYGFARYLKTSGGWYSIKKDGKEGACDLKGNEIIPPIWDYVRFVETYYEVEKDGKMGIRDLYNKEIIPADKYDEIRYYQMQLYRYCEVMINNKVGVLSKDLKEVIPCQYDDTSVFSLKEQPFCSVTINNKQGVYDIKLQKELIPADKYDEIRYYQMQEYGYCLVLINNKVGVLSKDLKEVIPCKYDDIRFFELKDMGVCRVEMNGKCGLVNKEGKEIVACIYDDIEEFYLEEYNYCVIVKNGKYGIINKNGQEITKCKYDDLKFSDGNLCTFNIGGEKVTIKGGITAKGGKWGVIDTSDKVVIPAEYDTPIVFTDGVAQVSKNGTASLLPHPNKGSSLTFVNGITNNEVDKDIPQTSKSNKETFAFVFANENYTNFSGADYSINDGKVFAEYCKKTLGLPEHNVRYFEDATYGNFVSAIKKIEDVASVYDGESTIIVYYSGLGTLDSQTKERYLLPSDAAHSSLEKTGYSVQKLIERLDALKTKGTYVLLDAPFTGTDKNGQALAESRGIRIAPKQLASSRTVLVCFSNSDNENSYASSKYGHGLFTYGILKKLKDSKGNCSWKELLESSSEWVKKESLQQYDKMQTPKYFLQESNNSIINKTF